MNEIIINKYSFILLRGMVGAANCAETDDDCFSKRNWMGKWTVPIYADTLPTANCIWAPENIFFTCTAAAVAKNRWQIESKSWIFFSSSKMLENWYFSISYRLYPDPTPAPTFYQPILCLRFISRFALLCCFTFVDLAGMSLCQTDVSSLQMNAMRTVRMMNAACRGQRTAHTPHTNTHKRHTPHKIEVEQVPFRQIYVLGVAQTAHAW